MKDAREQAGLTQGELTRLAGEFLGYEFSDSLLSRYESGTRKPSPDKASAIVKVLIERNVEIRLEDILRLTRMKSQKKGETYEYTT